MRGLGFALILTGVIGAVLTFLYPAAFGWGGLIGALAAILAGVGFMLHC